MSEARGRFEWKQTASVLAMIANVNRDTKKHRAPYKESDFNLFDQYDRQFGPKQYAPITALKALLRSPVAGKE